MSHLSFHLLNVFAEKPRSGDPLVVFDVDEMPAVDVRQALAYQMGQAESVFLNQKTLELHVHSSQFELPFSGRAALGAACVMAQQDPSFSTANFAFPDSQLTVQYIDGSYTFISSAGSTRPCTRGNLEIAHAFDIDARDITSPVLFVDSGLEQLVIQVRSRQSVLQAKPHAALLAHCAESPKQLAQAIIWSRDGELITLRCFSSDQFNVLEDFASASAAANIASYLLASGSKAPLQLTIEQGHTIQKVISRLAILNVRIDAQLHIQVSGKVQYLGNGSIEI